MNHWVLSIWWHKPTQVSFHPCWHSESDKDETTIVSTCDSSNRKHPLYPCCSPILNKDETTTVLLLTASCMYVQHIGCDIWATSDVQWNLCFFLHDDVKLNSHWISLIVLVCSRHYRRRDTIKDCQLWANFRRYEKDPEVIEER